MKYLLLLVVWSLPPTTPTEEKPLLDLYSATSISVEVVAKKTNKNPQYVSDYIVEYADEAVQEQEMFNIPASIKLAQGMLESSFGRSHAAKELNAHFCIKGKNTLSKKYYDKIEKSNSSYKGYPSVWWSIRDHSHLLVGKGEFEGNKNYSWIFNNLSYNTYKDKLESTNKWRSKNRLPRIKSLSKWKFNKLNHYQKVAHSIHVSGYATDKKYASKLIKIIERYSLYELDKIS